jgi:hypothetical protein
MAQTLAAAGFAIFNDTCIWATGETAEMAWSSLNREMAPDRITVVDENSLETDEMIDRNLRSSFTCSPATPALLAEIELRGRNIAWGNVGGVACTIDEQGAV